MDSLIKPIRSFKLSFNTHYAFIKKRDCCVQRLKEYNVALQLV